jgi:hypothetical protein
MSSYNPFSYVMSAVSPAAKKRKVEELSGDDVTLESVMAEFTKIKESQVKIEGMLKTLIAMPPKAEEVVEEKEEDAEEGEKPSDEETVEEKEEPPAEKKPEDDLSPSWIGHFEELKKFKEENGHCRISRSGGNAALGRWIIRQRSENKMGKMKNAEAKKAKLNSIDFDWTPQVSTPKKTPKKK